MKLQCKNLAQMGRVKRKLHFQQQKINQSQSNVRSHHQTTLQVEQLKAELFACQERLVHTQQAAYQARMVLDNTLNHQNAIQKLYFFKLVRPFIQMEKNIRSFMAYHKGFLILLQQKGSIGKTYQYLRRYTKEFGVQSSKNFLYHLHLSALENPPANPDFQPKISVIIPNYNHTVFLIERLNSILNQDYDLNKLELIVLNHQSKNNDLAIIQNHLKDKNIAYHLIECQKNQKSAFQQWKKGFETATGDLIWIAKGDGSCQPDFLKCLVPVFEDKAVNMAFGTSQFIKQMGLKIDGSAEDCHTRIFPAAQWFNSTSGVDTVFANTSECLLRKQTLPDSIWDKACEFQIYGDWYLYLKLAGAGKIAYVPQAISFFRQSYQAAALNVDKLHDYNEYFRILNEIQKQWRILPSIQNHFIYQIKSKYEHKRMDKQYGAFETQFAHKLNQSSTKENLHIQIYFLGFHVGGGELFPIVLANQLKELGYVVSIVALDLHRINMDMFNKLAKGIAVYAASDVFRQPDFLQNAGIDVVHTHIIDADYALSEYLSQNHLTVPYIVTMHGSHQKSFLKTYQKDLLQQIHQYVDKWVYIADKNLDFFDGYDLPKNKLIKLPNAMPVDSREANSNRKQLGIDKNAVVFAFAARGIAEKGWLQLVQAFCRAKQKIPTMNIHLVMMGEGKAKDEAQKMAQNAPFIHFLGYESAVNGVFRYSDCLILPSRFEGESYPLCLIQAIQEHLPCIATNIGEVQSMISNHDGKFSGILLDNETDDERFIQLLTDAIVAMYDDTVRQSYQTVAQEISERYDMKKLAEHYAHLYREISSK